MNEQQNRENRLWDYIDGRTTPNEKTAIENLIASNLEWQRSYSELLEVNQLMNSSELEAPSLRFSKNVMEEIAKYQVAPATKNYINKNIIWGIGGFFIVLTLGFLIYGFGQINWSTDGSSDLLPQFNLDKMGLNKLFNNTYTNIFIMINTVLGLMLLDMYLTRKKEKNHPKKV